jgi:hypothetical protein
VPYIPAQGEEEQRFPLEYLLYKYILAEESLRGDGKRFRASVPDADDFLAFDEYPTALVSFGKQSADLTPVDVTLRRERAAGGIFF